MRIMNTTDGNTGNKERLRQKDESSCGYFSILNGNYKEYGEETMNTVLWLMR